MTSGRTILSPVSKRYALALVDLATEGKLLPKVEKDLDTLEGLFAGSAEFMDFIASPSVGKGEQLAVVNDIAKKVKLQKITANFLGVVIQNGRLSELKAFVSAAKAEISKRRGEMNVDVVSAHVLSAGQQSALKAEIADATGKDILLNAVVNEDLIGGMVLTVGSTRIDSSVSGRLSRLKKAMGTHVEVNVNDNQNNLVKKEA